MPPLIGGIGGDAGTCSTPPYGSVNTGPPRRGAKRGLATGSTTQAFFVIAGVVWCEASLVDQVE